MNGRTARKLLMKRRYSSFFGERASFTVRVSPEAFPEPYPGMPEGFNEDSFVGMYAIKRLGVAVQFSELSCSEETAKKNFLPTMRSDKWWSCWQIDWWSLNGDGEFDKRVESGPNDGTEWLSMHIKAREWVCGYIHGLECANNDSPMLQKMIGATNCSKTVGFDVHESGDYLITFVVKWFHAHRRLRFSSAVSKWIQAVKDAGIRVSVV